MVTVFLDRILKFVSGDLSVVVFEFFQFVKTSFD